MPFESPTKLQIINRMQNMTNLNLQKKPCPWTLTPCNQFPGSVQIKVYGSIALILMYWAEECLCIIKQTAAPPTWKSQEQSLLSGQTLFLMIRLGLQFRP